MWSRCSRLPDSASTVYGLPAGAVVSDGKNSVNIKGEDTALNMTGWNLSSLTLSVPGQEEGGYDGSNTLNLQVVATSVESVNGSMAGIAKNVTVQLLDGQACATPVGVNPYVSYVNNVSRSQILKPQINQIVIASPLVPVSSSYPATGPMPQWTAYSDLNTDSDQDNDKIKPVVDWSAQPEDFLFDDGANDWSDGGTRSSWLTGFLGTDKIPMPDAASLSNLSVRLAKDSSTSLSE